MASSKASPAASTEEELATPLRLRTAISVVPPPTSTTMWPLASSMGRFAPRAAASGSSIRYTRRAPASMAALMTVRSSTSVTPEGTQMTTRGLGLKMEDLTALRNRCWSIWTVISWSEMTPSFRGRMATTLPGVRPSMFRAAAPTCRILPVFLSTATTEGSRMTTPWPST